MDPRRPMGEDIRVVSARTQASRRCHPCSWIALGAVLGCGSQRAANEPTALTPTAPSQGALEAQPAPPPTAGKNATAPTSAPDSALAAKPETPEARLAFWKDLFRWPRHHPALLDAEPRPCQLAPGPYACRVSREYRLRDCRVERTAEGRTLLEVGEGNLLGMRGVLWDEGQTLRFEGWLTEEQPFGCASCQDRCYAYPGSCACDPLPAEAIRECLQQPLRITFRPAGKGRYQGNLEYSVYYNEYVGEGSSRHPQGYVAKPEQFEVLLVKGPPPEAKKR